jgi:hypothetical protein
VKYWTIAIAILSATTLICHPVSAQPAFTGKGANNQKMLMKNWALSTCFARIAQDQATKTDAGLTASAYLQNSQQDIEDFDKIDKIVDKVLAMKYGGSVQSNYNTMKCIDLFHSKELDRLVGKLVRRR